MRLKRVTIPPIILMLMASFCFAVMGAFVKQAHRLPAWEIVFFRSFINLLWMTPWALSNSLKGLWKKEPLPLLVRGVAGCTSMFCYYYGIEHLHLADSVMLANSSPIFVLIFSALFLGERLSGIAIGCVAVALAGVAMILKPEQLLSGGLTSHERIAGLVGATGAVIAAIAYVSIKIATRSLNSNFIVFTFALVASAVSFVPMVLQFTQPTPMEWIYLAGTGLSASAAQVLMTSSYSKLPASVASPMMLVVVLFSALFGWFFWGEIPDRMSQLGAALVALGLTCAYRYRWRAPI